MKKNNEKNLFLWALILLMFSSCSSSKETVSVSDEPLTFEDVSYVQLIQPAFADDYKGKGVIFESSFFQIMNMTLDLPNEYKDIICISEETVLNIYFYNKWKELSAVYNVCPNWEHAFRGCSPEDLKGIILHTYSCFVPEYRKFWESASPFFKEWNYNLSKSDLIDIKKPLKAKKKYTKKQEEEYGREIHNLMKNYPNVIEDMKKRVKIVEKKNKAQEKKSKMIRRKEKVSSFFRNLRSKIKGKR